MRMPFAAKLAMVCSIALSPAALLADYTYQETTQITGGSLLKMIKMAGAFSSEARKSGDPVITTVYLKGNRLARVSAEQIQIIDLDKETITQVDTAKRTYTVMTFQQMRDQIAKAEQEAQKHPAQESKDAPPPNKDPNNDVKLSFDVKVRNTGVDKQVSGLQSKEAILTMTMIATDQKSQQSGAMAVTNDMWMVPEIPGYEQVRDFNVRMAEKMGMMTPGVGLDMSKLLAQNPGATQALTDMSKEMEKIKGVPILQVMRMGMTTDGKPLPAASEAPLPADSSGAMPSGSDVAKQTMASALTSKLSGFGFGKKKKDAPPADEQNANQNGQGQAQPTAAILMETQISTSNFSTDPVDASHFEVPTGFKQIQTR